MHALAVVLSHRGGGASEHLNVVHERPVCIGAECFEERREAPREGVGSDDRRAAVDPPRTPRGVPLLVPLSCTGIDQAPLLAMVER